MDINENNRRVNEIAIEMGASSLGPCSCCGFEMYSGFGHMCSSASLSFPPMDVLAERERCAKIADSVADKYSRGGDAETDAAMIAAEEISVAVRSGE